AAAGEIQATQQDNGPESTIPTSRSEELAAIRRSGRQLHFPVCLTQQILRSTRMTAHVKLVRNLRGGDFVDGLFDETLCGEQIRMPVRIDILPDDYAGSENSQTQDGAQYQFVNFHGKTSGDKVPHCGEVCQK